jgi:hypothetical protein
LQHFAAGVKTGHSGWAVIRPECQEKRTVFQINAASGPVEEKTTLLPLSRLSAPSFLPRQKPDAQQHFLYKQRCPVDGNHGGLESVFQVGLIVIFRGK